MKYSYSFKTKFKLLKTYNRHVSLVICHPKSQIITINSLPPMSKNNEPKIPNQLLIVKYHQKEVDGVFCLV